MAQNRKINPQRLAAMLDQYPHSQKKLANAIGTDVGTLSRWKTGKIGNIRSEKLARLCEALDTTPTELCADGAPIEGAVPKEKAQRDQVTFMLDTACRNALGLVARRYGITRQQVVELAPLLFTIMAEQSLTERSEELDAYYDSGPQHLLKDLRGPRDEDDKQLLDAERRSIEQRDLFAAQVLAWDECYEEANPFARFLTERLSKTGVSPGGIVVWDGDEAPRYWVGIEELVAFIGKDQDACNLVLTGKVALAEMPGEIRRAEPQDRASWIKEKKKRNDSDLLKALNEFDPEDLDIAGLADKLKLVKASGNDQHDF